MAADAYAVGWIAAWIWQEEWDPQYFTAKKTEQYVNLKLKLESLRKEDVRKRSSVQDVIETLTIPSIVGLCQNVVTKGRFFFFVLEVWLMVVK